jgi:excisionase family DNA binding protein
MFESYSDLVGVEEFASMLNIGKGKAYKLLASGKIKCFKENRVWIIPKEGIIQYIKEKSNLQ